MKAIFVVLLCLANALSADVPKGLADSLTKSDLVMLRSSEGLTYVFLKGGEGPELFDDIHRIKLLKLLMSLDREHPALVVKKPGEYGYIMYNIRKGSIVYDSKVDDSVSISDVAKFLDVQPEVLPKLFR